MDIGGKMEFKEVLEDLMSKRELTISQLAKDTGISKSSIHGFLNGVEPQLSRMLTLANYFSVSLDFLTTGTGHAYELLDQTLTVYVEKKQYEVTIKKIRKNHKRTSHEN